MRIPWEYFKDLTACVTAITQSLVPGFQALAAPGPALSDPTPIVQMVAAKDYAAPKEAAAFYDLIQNGYRDATLRFCPRRYQREVPALVLTMR